MASTSSSSFQYPASSSSQPSSSRASSPAIPIIQPDHFYGSEGVQFPPSPHSEGKTWLDPDDDPLASRGIPVFRPSMEEFQDFEGYMKRIECWGQRSGIVKVIPPKAWYDVLPSVTDKLADIKLHHPIEQHMIGRAGLFRQKNVETYRKLSVREWVELCSKDAYRAPGVDELGPHSSSAFPSFRPGRSRKKTKELASALNQPEPSSSLASPAATPLISLRRLESETPFESIKQEDTEAVLQDETRAAKDAVFMEDFDPDSEWLPPNTTPFDYTPDFCHQLERKFWRSCGMGTPAQYGADMAGSLFHDETVPWNVASLPSTLERIMPRSKHPMPGVNLPYLYFGMWRATFAWHVEDCDLFSINYIHFGAGKFWYAIPQGRANAFETVMRGYFPEGPNTCSQFLRHKAFLASPTVLAKASCRPNTLVQHAGEFVITYPRGYHAGFNLGFNCAESVNFALDSWLDLGRKAKYCTCIGDSVRIDVDALLREREDEYVLESIAALGPMTSCQLQDDMQREEDETTAECKQTQLSRKRKADQPNGGPSKPKRSRGTSSASDPSFVPSLTKVVLKLGPRPAEDCGYPCVLCVSTRRDGLLPVHDRPRAVHSAFSSIPEGPWMAHEHCARVVPETWVDETGEVTADGARARAVFGVDSIIRDRWNLRCAVCTKTCAKMHGAPVQCTKGRCPKAFHVSCAREGSDIIFEEKEAYWDVIAGERATSEASMEVVKVITKMEFQLLCAQHNPAILQARKASKADKVRQELLTLPPGARIKIRGHSGVFEVSLVGINDQARTVDVIWDHGTQRTFKWASIIPGEGDLARNSPPGWPEDSASRDTACALYATADPGAYTSISMTSQSSSFSPILPKPLPTTKRTSWTYDPVVIDSEANERHPWASPQDLVDAINSSSNSSQSTCSAAAHHTAPGSPMKG
ncbi:JmjC domain, hydroxylase-domain-containing protein [Vararia minispora EC-137]|uniref:JmjC domain, hydroxylase-domain-containing protein n=1 Tax=Vararia minispora EC-137 TaxID=1314806 RepID=A0ACB8Q9W2_9AGAM|nr:JmjC domain, hydroxylase-domain-containing protein [Vararia minispora EC-137]